MCAACVLYSHSAETEETVCISALPSVFHSAQSNQTLYICTLLLQPASRVHCAQLVYKDQGFILEEDNTIHPTHSQNEF